MAAARINRPRRRDDSRRGAGNHREPRPGAMAPSTASSPSLVTPNFIIAILPLGRVARANSQIEIRTKENHGLGLTLTVQESVASAHAPPVRALLPPIRDSIKLHF